MTADLNPELGTPRLRLEPQISAHAGAMLEVLSDPRTHEFIPTDPPTDLDALAARYARLETRRSPAGTQAWLNWVVFAGAQAIGTVQATVREAEQEADVAYVFHPGAWGQGYAGEALSALLAHLRGLGVQTALANIDTRNAPSRRLVERLGFRHREVIRGADEFKGAVSDEDVYVLALADWSSKVVERAKGA